MRRRVIPKKKLFKIAFAFVVITLLIVVVFLYSKQSNLDNGQEGMSKAEYGLIDGQFNLCPNKDNCRSSDDLRDKFHIEPIADIEARLWEKIPVIMDSLPRVKIQELSEDYMHFTQSSALFRFVDDIEFHRRPESSEIAIRSASRLGYRDFGVNEERIEKIRSLLAEL